MKNFARLELTRLDTFEQFSALKAEWDALAATQVKTIFLTNDWLTRWWQFYGANNQLWTLVARDHGELVGIAPLMLERDSVGFRRLVFMGAGEVTPNHLDIIARTERRLDVLRELSIYLSESRSQWDILELDKLPLEAGIADHLKTYLYDQGLLARVDVSAHCPYAELSGSFEAYLQSRSSATRSGFRRKQQYLERDFSDAHFARVETSDELNVGMDALVRMHQTRWTQKGYTGAFYNECSINFHRAMALRALQTKNLRFYFLRIGTDIAATYYCYRIGDDVQYYLGGFDHRWAKYSPGILINAYAIEQSIVEGAQRFDFLEGEELYKEHWSTHTRDNLCLHVFSTHWRGKLAQVCTDARTGLLNWGIHHIPVQVRRPLWLALQRRKADSQKSTH